MKPFIEKIVDVKDNGNCGFRAIAEYMDLSEESHVMVRRVLIQEVKDHRTDYMQIHGSGDRFNYILSGLYHFQNSSGIVFKDKW